MSLATWMLSACAVIASGPEIQPSDADVIRLAQAPARGLSNSGSMNSSGASGGSRNSASPRSNSFSSVARVPNMFGDAEAPFAKLSFGDKKEPVSVSQFPTFADTDVPLGGAAGRYLPIGENNRPIPTDRVFFLYNGFQNAISTFDAIQGRDVDQNLNRYTFGVEKTFQDGLSSVEIRFPLGNEISAQSPFFTSQIGSVGNLNVILKHLIYQEESLAVAVGMGLSVPTGNDVIGTMFGSPFRLSNDAVYLLPYLGGTYAVDDWFVTGYTQVDVAAGGDELTVEPFGSQGRLTTPTFMRFDVSVGRWLVQDAGYQFLSGVAVVGELHYVTTLNNTDSVGVPALGNFRLSYDENRVDFLNLTTGLHFQLTELSNLRVGGVFPIRRDPDRQFDSEIQVSFNRQF